MDLDWTKYPKDSVSPITGYTDPLAGKKCNEEAPYHNQYVFAQEISGKEGSFPSKPFPLCNYKNTKIKTPKPIKIPQPTLNNVSLEATFNENSQQPKENSEVLFDLKNALFKDSNDNTIPVQTLNPVNVKEGMTTDVKPWWKNPVELINFKALFEEQNTSYNGVTNHWSRIILFTLLASILLSNLLSLNVIVWITLIVLVVYSVIRNEKNTNSKEEFCETPALGPDDVNVYNPQVLMKNEPRYFKSINQNFWDQIKNRRPINFVCPTSDAYAEARRFMVGDTVKRHIFY